MKDMSWRWAGRARRRRAVLDEADLRIRSMSRRSFLWASMTAFAAAAGVRWLETRPPDGGMPWPFRRVFEFNEEVAMDLYSPSRLAPTFPLDRATEPYLNGQIGMDDTNAAFDPNTWKLRLQGCDMPGQIGSARGPRGLWPGSPESQDATNSSDAAPAQGDERQEQAGILLTMADLRKLPHVEMVTQFKCIEGWSNVVHWGGVRLSDFMTKYPPITLSGNPADPQNHPEDLPPYLALETPDGGYYVGLDMQSALHPQTLLAYELGGGPLTLQHGAPLRLVTTVKYGIKQLKRIGLIRYTTIRPRDYWAERGYDWYSGH